MKEVTLRDVAKEAGVSLATVSFALRNSPKISQVKRDHIQQVAASMGYRQNPLVSASMARIRGTRAVNYQATLGWVNDSPDADAWKSSKMYLGAQARAEELGFVLDDLFLPEIRMDEPEVNVRRFCQIAQARGIHGVLLPEPYRWQHAREPWPDMAVVVIGHITCHAHHTTLSRQARQSPYNSVVAGIFTNLWAIYDALHERGYQRIGLTGTDWLNQFWDNQLRAAGLEFNEILPAASRVAPFMLEYRGKKVPDSFRTWIKDQRPDVVIACIFEVGGWLEQLGLKAPEDIGLANINLGPLEQGWSGLDQRNELIGAAAVDLLSSHMIRNDRGVPLYPKRVTIPGIWVDGETTRPMKD